jgi:hypothetical protein
MIPIRGTLEVTHADDGTSYGTFPGASQMPETPCCAGHPKSHKTRPQ